MLDDVRVEDTAGSVLLRIAAKTGVSEVQVTGLRLVKAGKQLDLEAPCGLERDEAVHVAGRLDGGGLDTGDSSYAAARRTHLKRAREHPSRAVDDLVPSAALKTWQHALAGTCALFHSKLATAADACSRASEAAADWRVWAFDISHANGAKCFVAAPTAIFADAYLSLAPSERHAYESVKSGRGCFAYFDLDAAITSEADAQRARQSAAQIIEAAVAVLRELAGAQSIDVDVLTLDATRPCKFSQHLILRSANSNGPVLLSGPTDAAMVAELVRQRLRSSADMCGAAQLIDRSVYGDHRLFRLVGSTKLADPYSRPFVTEAQLDRVLLLCSLVAPSVQQACSSRLTVPPVGKLAPAEEAAWTRFQAGESIQQIADGQPSGKSIAPRSVFNYILAALKQGRPLEMIRFERQSADVGCAPPSPTEWDQLLSATNASAANVTQTQLLATFLPEAAKPPCDRTLLEKATLSAWHVKASWFLALRHAHLTPSFESSARVHDTTPGMSNPNIAPSPFAQLDEPFSSFPNCTTSGSVAFGPLRRRSSTRQPHSRRILSTAAVGSLAASIHGLTSQGRCTVTTRSTPVELACAAFASMASNYAVNSLPPSPPPSPPSEGLGSGSDSDDECPPLADASHSVDEEALTLDKLRSAMSTAATTPAPPPLSPLLSPPPLPPGVTVDVQPKHGGFTATVTLADGQFKSGPVSRLKELKWLQKQLPMLHAVLDARVQQKRDEAAARRRNAEEARTVQRNVQRRATGSRRRGGTQPRGDVLELLYDIHQESGYQVSANAEQLTRCWDALHEKGYSDAEIHADAEYVALQAKVAEDVDLYAMLTEDDNFRMVENFAKATSDTAPLCGCASCGKRDLAHTATEEFCLEAMPADHWLRYDQASLDKLNALPQAVAVLQKDDATGSVVERSVDLQCIKSYYKSLAATPVQPRACCCLETLPLNSAADAVVVCRAADLMSVDSDAMSVDSDATLSDADSSDETAGGAGSLQTPLNATPALDDPLRYFHVHPELVDPRPAKDGGTCSVVKLCAKCATAARAALQHKPRSSDSEEQPPPKTKPPTHSIAAGRDYGRLHRLGLERLSAAERVVLAPARTYGVMAKVHVPDQPAWKDPARREVLKGSMVAFNHAGREVLGQHFDRARVQNALKQIQLVFVSNRGKVDKLEFELQKQIRGLRLDARVMYNHLKVQLALFPDPDTQLPTFDEFRQLFSDAEATLARHARWTNGDAVERIVKEKASDAAGVREAARDREQAEEMAYGECEACSDEEADGQPTACAECNTHQTCDGGGCACARVGAHAASCVQEPPPGDFSKGEAKRLLDAVWRALDRAHPQELTSVDMASRSEQSRHVEQYLLGGYSGAGGDPSDRALLNHVAHFWENVVVDWHLGSFDSVFSEHGTCFSNSSAANFHCHRGEALALFRRLLERLQAEEMPIFEMESAGVFTHGEAGGAANLFNGVIHLLEARDPNDDLAAGDADHDDESGGARVPDAYQVPRGKVALNEFTENAALLYGCFWDHFPLREGLARNGPLHKEEARQLLTQFDNEFAHDTNLLFMLGDQKQRHAACRGVARRIKSSYAAHEAFAKKVQAGPQYITDLKEARDHVLATGKTDAKGRELMKEISRFMTLGGACVPWSEEERNAEITKFYANARRFGGGSCFLTVALDDVHQPTVIRLCYRAGKPDEFPAVEDGLLRALRGEMDEEGSEYADFVAASKAAATTAAGLADEEYEFKLSEAFVQRLATLNPVATTLFYEHMCEAIFTHLVGLAPTGKRNVVYRPVASRRKGLFGVPFCASAVTELNQRRSMHFHACINGGSSPALLSHVAGHKELEGLVCDALDSMFKAHVPLEIHAVDIARKALKVKMVRHTLLPMRLATDPEFEAAACFAATATGTHKCTFTCEKYVTGKTRCRMSRPAGYGDDLDKGTRVVEVVSTAGKPLSAEDEARREEWRCKHYRDHPWLETIGDDERVRGTTHLQALKTRPGCDLNRACLMYELERPLLTADSTHCKALASILKLDEKDSRELCDRNDQGFVRLRLDYIKRVTKDLGYLLMMPEAGKGLEARLDEATGEDAAKLIRAWRKNITSRNASQIEFSPALMGCVRCNAPPLLLGAGAGNQAANMYMRKVGTRARMPLYHRVLTMIAFCCATAVRDQE